jgi:pilus assembly protein CpaE
MIDILLISSSDDRARHIGAMLGECGVAHRLRNAQGTARQVKLHGDAIKAADLVIVDDVDLTARDLTAIEETIAHTPRLNCMLVTPAMSTGLLMAAMRAGVRHVMSWPLDRQEFVDALEHVASKKTSSMRREGRVVSFTSCKGGSGTTFIAMNLAHTLATLRDKRVLLIDLNQQFSDASLLVADEVPAATLTDLCAKIDRLDAALFDACVMHVHPNLDVLAGSGDPIKAGEVRHAHLARILALVRAQYDVVIVDIGQSVNPLAIHALDQSDTVCVIVRQSILYLHAGRRMLDIFRELGYPPGKVRLIVNQFDKHAQISLETLEETLDAKVAHQLPSDEKHVHHAINQGVPLFDVAKGSALALGIRKLADLLWPLPAAPSKSVLGRLFSARPHAVQQLTTEH